MTPLHSLLRAALWLTFLVATSESGADPDALADLKVLVHPA